MLNLSCFVALLFLSLNHSISALSCYECQSTFPASSICLPSCSTRFIADSTCVLIRNISLEPNNIGSLRAAHIGDVSSIPSVSERSFIFGEEAVYRSPSETVGWDWEYGPITYGCDTNGCNEPGDVNRLPNALNARIPNATLDRLLLGDIDTSCYVCDKCVDADVTNTDMSGCTKEPCSNHACGLVATRNSPSSIAQCGTGWHFSSYCMGSRELAQVDMTLIYYIRSKTSYLYQMEAVCLSNDCNNMTTFRELKNAITIDPDLTCLIDNNGTITSTTTRSSTSNTGTTILTTSSPTTAIGQTTSRQSSTSSSMPTETTTSDAPIQQVSINIKLFIFISLYFLFH